MRPFLVLSFLNCALALAAAQKQPATAPYTAVYRAIKGTDLAMDIIPSTDTNPAPIILFVHGGGWSGGSRKDDMQRLVPALTNAGFAWCSIDYRLAPTNPWPACIEDVQAALRWVKTKKNAASFNGDPNRVALVGYSAGGHLACYSGVLADDTTRVLAVVGIAAPNDHLADSERRGGLSKSMQNLLGRAPELTAESRAVLRDISPINYIKPGLPPFLLLQGTADKSVPYTQSVAFHESLLRAGVDSHLIVVTNGTHRISDWQSVPDWEAQIVSWLKKHMVAVKQDPRVLERL